MTGSVLKLEAMMSPLEVKGTHPVSLSITHKWSHVYSRERNAIAGPDQL